MGPSFGVALLFYFYAHNTYLFVDIYAHDAYKGFMHSKEVLQKLAQEGFTKVSQKGSHIKMRHPDGRTVIVPHPKKDLPTGTLKNIEAQAKVKF